MSTRLSNEFTVPVPVEQAWAVLLDVERIAPCMPGATLETVEGDVFTGSVKVKVGPISVTYRGKARFTDRDEAARVVRVDAAGKEARGSGTAAADVTASLHGDGGSTRVRVETDLNVTGKVAQFGRGVMADVSGRLVDRFAENLAAELGRESGAPEVSPVTVVDESTGASSADRSAAPAASRPGHADSLDLLGIAGGPVLKRVLPVAGAAVLVLLVVRWLRGRR